MYVYKKLRKQLGPFYYNPLKLLKAMPHRQPVARHIRLKAPRPTRSTIGVGKKTARGKKE